MAHETLQIAHVIPYGTDTARIEKALRFLPPKRFFVPQVKVEPQHKERVEGLLGDGKTTGVFGELEIRCLCGLESLPEAHAAIAITSSSIAYSSSIQSHYSLRAVLVEAERRKGAAWKYERSTPFVSEFVMPYWGTAGTSAEQEDVATAALLKGLFLGWQRWSAGHSSRALKRLKLA